MKLAVLLFRYFPYGGLQRDCLAIAGRLSDRGHAVEFFVADWQGPRPPGMAVRVLPSRALANHARDAAFARAALAEIGSGGYDGVVGFDLMPGLDCYYAGARCYLAESATRRGWLYRMSPRCRRRVAFERAVFEPAASTRVLLLDPAEQAVFQRCYGTPAERFHHVPPGIVSERRRPADAARVRAAQRQELGLAEEDRLLLLVGGTFRRKGVDRALLAVAALPQTGRARTRFLVVTGEARPANRLARRLGVADRVQVVAGREDILPLFLAADLLLHPARSEFTGTVILEALAAGLPVLCTAVCGYAEHVRRADAGVVLAEPFDQGDFDASLARALAAPGLAEWSHKAAAYGATADIYRGRDVAADIIERLIASKRRLVPD